MSLKRLINLLIPITIFIIIASGCAKTHSFRTFLLEEDKPLNPGKFKMVKNDNNIFLFGNPIEILGDSKFGIKILEIRPGWIHQDKKIKMPKQDKEKWGKNATEHIISKELWLITHITSLDNSDVLEINNKNYYHATNVKFDIGSYGTILLSDEEKYVFIHDADSSYRISFRLYEVDQFAFKRQLMKVIKDPGVSGVVWASYETFKNTASSFIGQPAVAAFNGLIDNVKEQSEKEMLLERLLLQASSVIEFQGSVVFQKAEDNFSDKRGTKVGTAIPGVSYKVPIEEVFQSREFMLYDFQKSKWEMVDVDKSRESYLKNLDMIDNLSVNLTDRKSVFIRFSVEEVIKPTDVIKEDTSDIKSVIFSNKKAKKLFYREPF